MRAALVSIDYKDIPAQHHRRSLHDGDHETQVKAVRPCMTMSWGIAANRPWNCRTVGQATSRDMKAI